MGIYHGGPKGVIEELRTEAVQMGNEDTIRWGSEEGQGGGFLQVRAPTAMLDQRA
jgi:hypothetical protein